MKLVCKVASLIEDAILSGEIPEGGKLPSIRETAKKYEISHVTSSKVYRKMEEDGLIASTPRGYVVRNENSDYVRDYHMKRIERAFAEIRLSQEKLGYTDTELSEYLKTLIALEGDEDGE